MRGVLSVGDRDRERAGRTRATSPSMTGLDLATRVSTPTSYEWDKPSTPCSPSDTPAKPAEPFCHVVAYDYGIKRNILRRLVQVGAASPWFRRSPPPKTCSRSSRTACFSRTAPAIPSRSSPRRPQVRKLIGKKPIFGICLGHQILGLGARRQDLQAEVRASRRQSSGAQPSHRESRDHLAQSRLRGRSRFAQSQRSRDHARQSERPDARRFPPSQQPVFCVQYHPEAAPGPHDSHYLFDDFVKLIKDCGGR